MPKGTAQARACAHCGDPISGRAPTAKYCQDLCARRAYSKARQADGRHKAYKATEAAKEAQRRYLATRRETRPCQHCGTPYSTRKDHPTRYCTRRCAALARTAETTATRKPKRSRRRYLAETKLQRATHGTQGQRWVEGPCLRCGTRFALLVTGVPGAYCSRQCSKGSQRERRRAIQHNAFVEPVFRAKVYERDDWTCHICGKPVDRNAVAPHPLSPTIDHVVALAAGGKHSMANVKTAHWLCNSTKGDRPLTARDSEASPLAYASPPRPI